MSRIVMHMLCALSLCGTTALMTGCGGGSAMPPSASANDSGGAAAATRNVAGLGKMWTVQAGASTLDQSAQDLDFYDNTITIDAGDSVTWRIAAEEPHTISFLAPGQKPPNPASPQATTPAGGTTEDGSAFTSSGLITDGKQYTLTFPKAGTYVYHCLLHQPQMMGTVVVQSAGTTYPHAQGFYTHNGAIDEWKDLIAAELSVQEFPFTPHGKTIAAGTAPGLAAGKPADSTVLRFIDVNTLGNIVQAGNVTVKVGTTLTWVNESNNEPHTVTFPPLGQVPNLPPFAPPMGGSTYDGSMLTNSGVFFPGQHYSLTFTKVGFFKYYCLFHDDQGMVAYVNVVK
ncbi:MAG TPA: plastocyanin/azurin family copper-binding protein [Candidatus Baltobacteraceae bacterium]